MNPKYIDERFRRYFEFGRRISTNLVDLNNGVDDVCSVSEEDAERLIKDRDDVLGFVHHINEKFPDEFREALYSYESEQNQ